MSVIEQFQGLVNRMKKELAKIYLLREDALRVARQTGLQLDQINFEGRALDFWGSILLQAIDENKLADLAQFALSEHPESNILLEASNLFFHQEDIALPPKGTRRWSERGKLEDLLESLNNSWVGFVAQANNRDRLYKKIRDRLDIDEHYEFEDFFSRYYDEMNQWEKRLHSTIRGYTDYIKINNEKAFKIIDAFEGIDKKIKRIRELKRHLELWLFKYNTIFQNDETMCLVYVGVHEKYPFPRGVEQEIEAYLNAKRE